MDLSKLTIGGSTIFRREDISTAYDVHWAAKLGQGGGGTVYKCTRRKDQQAFAVKMMEVTKRSTLEIELAYHVSQHVRSVVAVEDVFHNIICFSDGRQCERYLVVMECCKKDLFDYIQEQAGVHMTEDSAREMFRNIVRAVYELHRLGVVHRDIKPDNILLDGAGQVKLTDFGWAKLLTSESGNTTLLGTARHMPPEIFSGKYGFEVDVFSLGTVLYYMLSGSLPYLDWEMDDKRSNRGLSKLDGPSWAAASADVRDLLKRMLDGDPARRPKLEDVLRTDPWLARGKSFPNRVVHYSAVGDRKAFKEANLQARGDQGDDAAPSPAPGNPSEQIVGTAPSVPQAAAAAAAPAAS